MIFNLNQTTFCIIGIYTWSIFGLFIVYNILFFVSSFLKGKNNFHILSEEFFNTLRHIIGIYWDKKFDFLKNIIKSLINLNKILLIWKISLLILFSILIISQFWEFLGWYILFENSIFDFIFNGINTGLLTIIFFLLAFTLFLVSIFELKYIFSNFFNIKKNTTFYFLCHFSIIKSVLSLFYIFNLGVIIYMYGIFNKSISETFLGSENLGIFSYSFYLIIALTMLTVVLSTLFLNVDLKLILNKNKK